MKRVTGAILTLVLGMGVANAADTSVEGELLGMASADLFFRSQPCSKFFVTIPKNGPDTREGVAFRFPVFGVPTVVLTAVDRVTIEIDETRTVPYANVELLTGYFYTKLKISQKELDEARCLASSPRAK